MVLAFTVLLVTACSGGDDGGTDAAASATTAEPTTSSVTPQPTVLVTEEGAGGSVQVLSNPRNVLSALVRVATDVPSTAGLTAESEDGHRVTTGLGAVGTDHELALVGLRSELRYEVTVSATGEDGEPIDVGPPFEVTSGALPDHFPPLDVEVDPDRSQGGLTLVSLKSWSPQEEGTPPVPNYVAIIDAEGEVVWYHADPRGILDARLLEGGTLLYSRDETVAAEVDLLGRPVTVLAGRVAREIAPVRLDGLSRVAEEDDAHPIETDSVHHDVGPLPGGNLLLLSTELLSREGPSQCGEDAATATYEVIADVVVEVDPRTGAIVQEWPIADIYDPFDRPGNSLCQPGEPFAPPNYFYTGQADDARDWTHGNSVVLDETRNALIVSLRHQDAVIAIRYHDDASGPAGELIWELGDNGDLALVGEPTSFQHAAEVLDEQEILVYDNGNNPPDAPDDAPAPVSRAVVYRVDDSAQDPSEWRAEQVWEHVLPDDDGQPTFTSFLGDVDELENGNVLVTHGAIADDEERLSARVVEVVRGGADDGEVVYDLRVGEGDDQWTVYRSQRVASLTSG